MQNPRHIRSYVLRAGRMTPAQERALCELWPAYGVDLTDGPIDLDRIFGRRAPRCLEIGFGIGEVIGSLAEAHPEVDYLGIEVHRPGVGRLMLRAAQANSRNLRVICHDAVEVMHRIPEGSLDEILIFFPDPWHKKRHHKRRLIEPQFVASVAGKLRSGGVLRLATDWEGYADQMRGVCGANPLLESMSADGTCVPRPDLRPPTRFERRGERLGHGVWDFAYTKRKGGRPEVGDVAPLQKAAANAVHDELHGEGGEDHTG